MSQKHVLVISYFAGMVGFSPAEWLDDKVDSFVKLGHKITLVSALSSQKCTLPGVTHYRIPSLTVTDFGQEKKELQLSGRKVPFFTYLLYPLIYTLGFLIDLMLKVFTQGVGGGRLSWIFTSAFTSIYLSLFKKVDIVFSTGGAASSHVVAVAAGVIAKIPIIVELQDPLSGEGIGRNSRSAQLLGWVEHLVVKFSKKVVFVTESAAREAREFYKTKNIVCIYPGSRKFTYSEMVPENKKFRFVHLGTLYSTRNFNTLIQAIDQLIDQKKITTDEIELINQGDIHGDYKTNYLSKSYFKQYPIRPRREAIEFCSSSNINLVVQHTDPRSSTTIPYKLYDYMNLNKPILGLINSEELKNLLAKHGHYSAQINNVDDIAEKVLFLLRSKTFENNQAAQIDAIEQAAELLK